MPNSFDIQPRSPSDRKLFVLGAVFIAIVGAISVGFVAKSEGQFDGLVRVTAAMIDVGDGLPVKSDVKFRGMLVGTVTGLMPARGGAPNFVDIALQRDFAGTIPNTVTARVVPSNVFAVSSIELVDNGPGRPMPSGATIQQDQSAQTLLFQTTLTKLRQLLAAVGRAPSADGIGPLTALGEALGGRGSRLREAAHDLKAIVEEMDKVVATETQPTTISAFADAVQGLQAAAPPLLDALDEAIQPARTLVEKQVALSNFLGHGLTTTGTLRDAFDHQTDRLINISNNLTPVIGVLGDNAGQIPSIGTRFVEVARKVLAQYHPERGADGLTAKTVVSLTPVRQYVRADCPHYGTLGGQSCATAPDTPTAPALMPALNSHGFPMPDGRLNPNRPNMAPPRDSVVHPGPGSPVRTSLPPPSDEGTMPAPSGAPASTAGLPPGVIQPQSMEIPGDIGPVGSSEEKAQLSQMVGGQASAATVLLLGPLVRGTTVHITTSEAEDHP